MFTVAFAKGLLERAVKTFAASLAGLLGTAGLGLLDVNWGSALSVAGLATLVTVLVAAANPPFVAGGADATLEASPFPRGTTISTTTTYGGEIAAVGGRDEA